MVQGVQFRRGTTAQHAVFTGQLGELTVDTDKKIVVVHDGSAAGGYELVGVGVTQTLTNKNIVAGVVTANVFSGSGVNLSGIVTSIVAGTGVTVSGSTGQVTLNLAGVVTSIVAGTGITISGSTGQVTINSTSIAGLGGTGQFTRTLSTFTATANQTTFSVSYIIGYVDVYLNGVRLSSDEYTASNGTSVVLSSGATLNDVIDIISYGGSGNALWNVGAGSSIYALGNVGIGTTRPTSKLHVLGDALVTGVTTITGNLNAPGNYYVKLARTGSDQTIPNATDTLIGLSVVSDPNSWYSGITTRTTPTVAGTYHVDGMVNWQAGSITNDQTNIQLRKNGNTFAISLVGIRTFSYTQNVCGIVTMNGTTDYIDFTVYTANPTSQPIRGTADGSWTKMEIFKIN